jgi:hypothetical protein
VRSTLCRLRFFVVVYIKMYNYTQADALYSVSPAVVAVAAGDGGDDGGGGGGGGEGIACFDGEVTDRATLCVCVCVRARVCVCMYMFMY